MKNQHQSAVDAPEKDERWHAIDWHVQAPDKPVEGEPCNGCGLCCLVEPCPLGMWVSRRRTGACRALQWSDAQQRYLCGMVAGPGAVLGWRWQWPSRLVARWARRWIASGIGCDAVLDYERPHSEVVPPGKEGTTGEPETFRG